MFYKQGFFTHRQFFVFTGFHCVYFSSSQRVPIQQIHIDHYSQSVSVGQYIGQLTIWIVHFEVLSHDYFRSNEIRSSEYIRRKLSGNDQAIYIYNGCTSGGRVYQYIFVGKVGMSQPCGVHSFYGTAYADTYLDVFKPVSSFFGSKETVLIFGRSKPFTLFFFSFDSQKIMIDRSVFKEEIGLISRAD